MDGAADIFRLDGRVALITGGGGGIGAATAHLMSALGAAVAVVDRSGVQAEKVASEIEAKGRSALAVAADISVATDMERAVEATIDSLGPLSILVANAAIQQHRSDRDIDTLAEETWDETLGVNLRGTFLTCRAGIRAMLSGGQGGAIVIVSSVAALTGGAANTAYAASKGGLVTMGRTIAVRYAARKIRCNVVCPGALETTPSHDMHPDPAGRARRLAQTIPLGRPGRNEEIAPMIAFLVSPASRYATGGVYVVDGGRTAA